MRIPGSISPISYSSIRPERAIAAFSQGRCARHHFYSVAGDIEALAVVIRKWLDANKRLESPKFIVGESYGGFRAPKLARQLQDQEGIGVEGLVLISPVLDFGWFEGANNPLTFATRLPSQAAAARGLAGRRRPRRSRRRRSLCGRPLPRRSFARRARSPALSRITEKVAGFTGLDPAFVRQLGGRIDPASFAREKARASAKVSSLYDAESAGSIRPLIGLERLFRSRSRCDQDAAGERHGGHHRQSAQLADRSAI